MTPHHVVKGTGHLVPLERHPEHSTKPKGPKLWENFHLLSPVTGSEVNDSRSVGSGHWALKGPSNCARDSDWKIPLILSLFFSFLFFFFLFFLFFFIFLFLFFILGLEGNPLLFAVSHLFGV